MDRDKRGGYNRKKIDEDFFKVWSPKMAYVLGFIYADGAVEDCRKSSRTCYLLLANNDLNILKDIMAAMSTKQTVHTIGPRVIKIRDKKYWCKTSYYVRIGNKLIYEDLLKLGLCPRKSLIIELPNIPEQYFQYFLRGYFDGDGCINIEKNKKNRVNVIFTSGSKIFLEQLVFYIHKIYPTIKCSISFGYGAYKLRYNWRNALMVAGYIYQDIVQAPYLKYKYKKYSEYLNERIA
ncbi:MAG TPA: LAGLIDADG family homing endonuclease [Spirochaetia bacterium]|nr:LAGLIDADG family homing endonuclease [Spirochaetia bacterium]